MRLIATVTDIVPVMTNVGFCGGSEVRELGPASDMQAFFGCIQLAVPHLSTGTDGGLITDRLYRRYLRPEELDPTKSLMIEIRDILGGFPSNNLNWSAMGWNPDSTRLVLSEGKAADVVHRYLKGVPDLIDNAASFQKRFQIYQPVMTIISDLPRFSKDRSRPLADYDALEGEPIWLR